MSLPADRALERSLLYLHGAVEEFIERARERMASRPGLREAPENFLEAMLAAQQAEGTFTDKEIIGNVFTLLLAGEDTTARTIGWTLWFLASRPEIQDRWANEARELLAAVRQFMGTRGRISWRIACVFGLYGWLKTICA